MWEAKLVAILMLMLILMLASCQLWARGKGAVSGGWRGRMANRSIFVVKISNVHFILIHFMWLLILRSNSLIFWPQIYNTQEARRHTHTLRQAGQHTHKQRGSQKKGERETDVHSKQTKSAGVYLTVKFTHVTNADAPLAQTDTPLLLLGNRKCCAKKLAKIERKPKRRRRHSKARQSQAEHRPQTAKAKPKWNQMRSNQRKAETANGTRRAKGKGPPDQALFQLQAYVPLLR